MSRCEPPRIGIPMNQAFRVSRIVALPVFLLAPLLISAQVRGTSILSRQLFTENFGNDASWFEENIPLLEISDPQIQRYWFR
jgi:hypothetical protein